MNTRRQTLAMRCEGVPSRRKICLPRNVCDRTVKNCQGDLFLCPACEESRFPTLSKKLVKDVKGKQNSVQVCSDSDASAATFTMCRRSCADSFLKCDVCCNVYDQQCSTLPPDVFNILYQSFSLLAGSALIVAIPAVVIVMQTAQITLAEKLADINTSLAYLYERDQTVGTEIENVKNTIKTIQAKYTVSQKNRTPAISTHKDIISPVRNVY